MLFNVEKCKVMHIGYDNMKAEYLMDRSQTRTCESERRERFRSENLKWEKTVQ